MVLTISRSSIILSFTGLARLWTRYTSLPRTLSPTCTCTSPSAKRPSVIFPTRVPSRRAMSSASSKWDEPEKILSSWQPGMNIPAWVHGCLSDGKKGENGSTRLRSDGTPNSRSRRSRFSSVRAMRLECIVPSVAPVQNTARRGVTRETVERKPKTIMPSGIDWTRSSDKGVGAVEEEAVRQSMGSE
uniref:Uncharacterized protein n=1 Tax=Hyaloperonospora arabidopsidis (strain Emoy2) TaxID=559515 RepID=M4B909_HYAAE